MFFPKALDSFFFFGTSNLHKIILNPTTPMPCSQRPIRRILEGKELDKQKKRAVQKKIYLKLT